MDVATAVGVLRRRWPAILVCLVAALVGSFAITRNTKDVYRSSTRLFVNIPSVSNLSEAIQGVQLSSALLESYARIATSQLAGERVAEKLELDAPPSAVAGKLAAFVEGDTLLLTIAAQDEDPEQARRLAEAAGEVFIELVDELESERDEAVQARVIDEARRPGTPVGPRTTTNVAGGIVVGLSVGAALAVLWEALDRTLKVPAQLAHATNAEVLGVVRRRRKANTIAPLDRPGDSTAEAYRALRTAIRFTSADRPIRSILVTSPAAEDGKTTTAGNLAVALARSGERVVALDADLRRPALATMLGVEAGPGLTSVLAGEVSIDEALQRSADGVDVLAAGPLPTNPAELVGSQAMADLLTELERRGGVVVIDAPPVLPVTDAVELATQVDGVVVVVRAGRTRREHAADAVRRLRSVGATVLGGVLNGAARSDAASYGDDYYPSSKT